MPNDTFNALIESINKMNTGFSRDYSELQNSVLLLDECSNRSVFYIREAITDRRRDYYHLSFVFNEKLQTLENEEDIKALQSWKEENLDPYLLRVDDLQSKYDDMMLKRSATPLSTLRCKIKLVEIESYLQDHHEETISIFTLMEKIEQNDALQDLEFKAIRKMLNCLKQLKNDQQDLVVVIQNFKLDMATPPTAEQQSLLERVQRLQKQLDDTIQQIDALKIKYNKSLVKEQRNVMDGTYQQQLFFFTYDHANTNNKEKRLFRNNATHYRLGESDFEVVSMMETAGLRCTAAIPEPPTDDDPIEVQINFMGTVDINAFVTDTEKGGPGQQKMKKYEAQLLEQVNAVIEQASLIYPDRTIRLRVAGHSLGGSLAKAFSHALQRAIAVLHDTPEAITDKIRHALPTQEQRRHEPFISKLQETLKKDSILFNRLRGLKKISGITLYTLGSPGVSFKNDRNGTLLTYYHDADFMRVYHHHHESDLITQYGESEFLSGRELEPRISHLYDVKYTTALSDQLILQSECLPLPHVTKRVMAAHNVRISERDVPTTQMTRMDEHSSLQAKFDISELERLGARLLSKGVRSLARVADGLGIPCYPRQKIATPVLTACREAQQKYKEGLPGLDTTATQKEEDTVVVTPGGTRATVR